MTNPFSKLSQDLFQHLLHFFFSPERCPLIILLGTTCKKNYSLLHQYNSSWWLFVLKNLDLIHPFPEVTRHPNSAILAFQKKAFQLLDPSKIVELRFSGCENCDVTLVAQIQSWEALIHCRQIGNVSWQFSSNHEIYKHSAFGELKKHLLFRSLHNDTNPELKIYTWPQTREELPRTWTIQNVGRFLDRVSYHPNGTDMIRMATKSIFHKMTASRSVLQEECQKHLTLPHYMKIFLSKLFTCRNLTETFHPDELLPLRSIKLELLQEFFRNPKWQIVFLRRVLHCLHQIGYDRSDYLRVWQTVWKEMADFVQIDSSFFDQLTSTAICENCQQKLHDEEATNFNLGAFPCLYCFLKSLCPSINHSVILKNLLERHFPHLSASHDMILAQWMQLSDLTSLNSILHENFNPRTEIEDFPLLFNETKSIVALVSPHLQNQKMDIAKFWNQWPEFSFALVQWKQWNVNIVQVQEEMERYLLKWNP